MEERDALLTKIRSEVDEEENFLRRYGTGLPYALENWPE